MSHAVLTVMVEPEYKDNYTARIRELMAPFDEKMAVDPYVDEDGYETTYNPISKWDYYSIIADEPAARWQDWEVGEPSFSLLSEDYGWMERATMGWFAMTTNEKEDWPEHFRRVYDELLGQGYIPYIIDYHI